jgi:hypothetical protein
MTPRRCLKGGGGSGGGGGSSGKVSWPNYLQDKHKQWLKDDSKGAHMTTAVRQAFNNSPYVGFQVFDPTTALASTDTRFAAFTGVLPSNETTDWTAQVDASLSEANATGLFTTPETVAAWETNVNEAITKADAVTLFGTGSIDDLVEQFDQRQQIALQSAVGRFAAGMADIGAVNSSAYIWGLALMEIEHQRAVAEFSAGLTQENRRDKIQFVDRGIQTIGAIKGVNAQSAFNNRAMKIEKTYGGAEAIGVRRSARMQMLHAAAQLQGEINRIKIVAEREYDNERLNVLVKHGAWNLEIFTYAGNLLAAVQGGTGGGGSATQAKTGDGMSQIGGALAGGASLALAATPAALASGPWAPLVYAGAFVVGAGAGYAGSQ